MHIHRINYSKPLRILDILRGKIGDDLTDGDRMLLIRVAQQIVHDVKRL